jgi:hypothetical protein
MFECHGDDLIPAMALRVTHADIEAFKTCRRAEAP